MTDTTDTTDTPTFTPRTPPADRAGMLARLREPFPPNQIGLLPRNVKKDDREKFNCVEGHREFRQASKDGKACGGWHPYSIHLDYVGHAALTDRLLDTDPEWTWEPLALGADGLPALDRNGGLWIRLTVAGVTRLGYGDAAGKPGPNAIKEAIGDALRNAGMRFGMALDLWHKGDLHDSAEQRGTTPPPVSGDDPRLYGDVPASEQYARPNQERRVDRPAVPGEGDEWMQRGLGVDTSEQVLEVYQAARKAGALGAAGTINGRTLTVRDYLRERGAGLKRREEAARAAHSAAAGAGATRGADRPAEGEIRADVLDPADDPAPWDLPAGGEPF